MANARVPFRAVDNVPSAIAHEVAIVSDEDAQLADRLFASMRASAKLVQVAPKQVIGQVVTKTMLAPTLKALLDFQVEAKRQIPPVGPINAEEDPIRLIPDILAQLVEINASLGNHGRLFLRRENQQHNLNQFRQGQDDLMPVCNTAGQSFPERLPQLDSVQAIRDLNAANLVSWARYGALELVPGPNNAARRRSLVERICDNVFGGDWQDYYAF
ncbi:hypothetical protein ACM66B_003342 [Microbotryomycetes sp. NB124-2]